MRLVSLVSTNTGVMLNLVTNDTQKVVDAFTFFHHGEGSHTNFINSIILNPSNFTLFSISTDERKIVVILPNRVTLEFELSLSVSQVLLFWWGVSSHICHYRMFEDRSSGVGDLNFGEMLRSCLTLAK